MPARPRPFARLLPALLLLWPMLAFGQTPPQTNPANLGQENLRLQQRLEAPPALEPQGPAVVGPEQPAGQALAPGGPRFQLAGIAWGKSKFLTTAELDAIAKRYIGHEVDFADLGKLVGEVNALYKAKGYVTASAVLPPQKVAGGVVRVDLVEGKLGQVHIDGDKNLRPGYVTDRLPLDQGQVLDVPELSQDVEYFNRTNDAQLKALLQPGASFGQTDVALAIQEPKRDVLDAFIDNDGPDTTSRTEVGLYYRRNDLLGRDDRLSFYGTDSLGSQNGSATYNLPVDVIGDRVGLTLQSNWTRTIDGPFAPLDIVGRSESAALDFTHPVIANQNWFLLGTGELSDTKSQSIQSGTMVSDDITPKETLGVTLTHDGPTHTVTITQNASLAESHDGAVGLDEFVRLFDGTASGLIQLPASFSIQGQAAWQYTPQQNLPGDQLFEIGGPNSVRGYVTDALGGDSGYYADLELHRDCGDVFKGTDAFVFSDYGTVFQPTPSRQTLQSYGLGASWNLNNRVTAQITDSFAERLDVVSDTAHSVIYLRLVVHLL